MASRRSRPARPGSSTAAPARSGDEGTRSRFGTAVGTTASSTGRPSSSTSAVVGRSRPLTPRPPGRVGLRVHVHQQHARAGLGEAGGQVDRGGRLAHAALLVGDGVDHARRPAGAAARPGRRGKRRGVAAVLRKSCSRRRAPGNGLAADRRARLEAELTGGAGGGGVDLGVRDRSPRQTTHRPADRDQRGRELQRHRERPERPRGGQRGSAPARRDARCSERSATTRTLGKSRRTPGAASRPCAARSRRASPPSAGRAARAPAPGSRPRSRRPRRRSRRPPRAARGRRGCRPDAGRCPPPGPRCAVRFCGSSAIRSSRATRAPAASGESATPIARAARSTRRRARRRCFT